MTLKLFKSTRRPQNEAEGAFYDRMVKAGWMVSKRGWPDFFAVKRGSDGLYAVCAVEVKRKRSQRLKAHQLIILQILAAYGLPAYRWTPDGGFERISPPEETPGNPVIKCCKDATL